VDEATGLVLCRNQTGRNEKTWKEAHDYSTRMDWGTGSIANQKTWPKWTITRGSGKSVDSYSQSDSEKHHEAG